MLLKINTKTLTDIKGFNPFHDLEHLKNFTREEMQQVLMVLSFIDYGKAKGLISQDLEVVIEHK